MPSRKPHFRIVVNKILTLDGSKARITHWERQEVLFHANSLAQRSLKPVP